MGKDLLLAFEGGGGKGAAYLSVIKALEDHGLTDRVKTVSGSSAGALNALMFVLGYRYEELVKIIFEEQGFKNFLPQERNEESHVNNFFYRAVIESSDGFENYFMKWSENDYAVFVKFCDELKPLASELIFSVVNNPNFIDDILFFYFKFKKLAKFFNHQPFFPASGFSPGVHLKSTDNKIKEKIYFEHLASALFFGGLFRGDEVLKQLTNFVVRKGFKNPSYNKVITNTSPFTETVIKDDRITYPDNSRPQNPIDYFTLDEQGELKVMTVEDILRFNQKEKARISQAQKDIDRSHSEFNSQSPFYDYNKGRNQEAGYNTVRNSLKLVQYELSQFGRLTLENIGLAFSRITFQQLFDKTGIKLILTGANVSKGKTVIFSKDHTPTFPVLIAVAISMNLPFIWPPVYIKSTSGSLDGWYVDGGLFKNFPIDILRKQKTDEEEVLGFYLDKKSKYINPFLPLNASNLVGGIASSLLDKSTFDFVQSDDSLALETSDQNFFLSTTDFEPTLPLPRSIRRFSKTEDYINAFENTQLHQRNYQKIANLLKDKEII